MYTLNCDGKLIDLSKPKIMGIINVTPDSFFDGGTNADLRNTMAKAEKMITEGATFIDVGGYSSRPGAKDISEEEETKRVLPTIEALRREFPKICISVDTFRSEVARRAVEAGANIVNDISGGMLDEAMIPTLGKLKVPYIIMHMKGTPQDMTKYAQYDNIIKEMLYYFSERIATAKKQGINDIIIDPGFGFAKTIAHNFELLNHLDLFKNLDHPILVGLSRKSTVYKTLGVTAEEALNGTTVLNTLALQKGANILRVHDVKEAQQCITLLEAITDTN